MGCARQPGVRVRAGVYDMYITMLIVVLGPVLLSLIRSDKGWWLLLLLLLWLLSEGWLLPKSGICRVMQLLAWLPLSGLAMRRIICNSVVALLLLLLTT